MASSGSKFKITFDNSLRPLGTTFIILFGLICILLSYFMREISNDRESITSRLLSSATQVENWFYDFRTARFYKHSNISPNLIILEVTDESLNKVGRWPWTRSKHAKIIDNLQAYGARVVMFDVTFPEPENNITDQALADSIKRFTASGERKSIVLGYGLTDEEDKKLKIPDELMLSVINGQVGQTQMTGQNYIDRFNYAAPLLRNSDANFGFITAMPDLDGVFRHSHVAIEQDGSFYPSLGLAGLNTFYSNGNDRKIVISPNPGTLDYELKMVSETGETSTTLNSQGEVKVRFFGGENSFTRVPIHEVFLDPAPAKNEHLRNIFQGKAVLIGSSAFGAHDLRNTPVGPQSPGMYLHANFFHALDQKLFFKPEAYSFLATLLLFFLGVIGVLLLARKNNPLYETGGTFILATGVFAADYFYFAPQGYFVRLFFCIITTVNLYGWYAVLNVFKEAKEKKKIKDAFQRYVAPEIVKDMLAHPEKLKVGGEKREITMIFSDVRDFTAISETLAPMELATLLNVYMGKMTNILFETHGTLDKYIGDALVGFWGAPLDVPDHAYHAVRGAILMLEALPAINDDFEKKKLPRINVGIGLNTGEVSVGNMGSDLIFQYTALGDAMNLASRLESLTKHYGINLLISEYTLDKMGEKRSEFKIRPLDKVIVKGRTTAVTIYEVIPSWSPWMKPGMIEKYCEAYDDFYHKRNFKKAAQDLNEMLKIIPDKNMKRLHQSAEAYAITPPLPEDELATKFTTK